MKFDLSKEQQQEIDKIREESKVCKYLDNIKHTKFTVGDILIKKKFNYDDKWEVEKINGNTGMTKRFVYVYEDKHGIGFVKSLKTTDGTLGKETICLADVDFDQIRFEVDPDYADQVLFGDDNSFNIKEFHRRAKEKKEKVRQMNLASRQVFYSLQDLNNFFSKLQPNDKFYTCGGELGYWCSDYKIISVDKKYINRLPSDAKDDLDGLVNPRYKNEDTKHLILDDNICYKLTVENSWGDTEEVYCFDYFGDFLYTQKPLTVDDQIL